MDAQLQAHSGTLAAPHDFGPSRGEDSLRRRAQIKRQRRREEFVNCLTHGGGFVLSVVGAVVLLESARRNADGWLVVGCGIYAASLMAVYAASALSHLFREPRLKRFFRTLDQAVIYLMIVGNYTPFALAFLSRDYWWCLLLLMWGVALVGFCSKILWEHRVEAVSVPTYMLLGWLPMIAFGEVVNAVPPAAIGWALAGGLFYMIGTLFLVFDGKARYFHGVWHLLVIAGSACHYVVTLRYVVTPGG